MKHTPGPWTINENLEYGDEYWFGGEKGFCIDVGPATIGGLKDKIEQGKANARLIAAAPELLDALKKEVSIIDTKEHAVMHDFICETISKAEGRES